MEKVLAKHLSKLSRAQLVMELEKQNMPTNGYQQDLQTRLKDCINQHTHGNVDPVVVYVQHPTAIESFWGGDTL